MDYSKKSREELIDLCKGYGVKGYSKKKKDELVKMLELAPQTPAAAPSNTVVFEAEPPLTAAHGSNVALSLFSGAGGDTCGLEKAGWKVKYFSEFNAPAIQTHKSAFPDSVLLTGADGSNDIKAIPDETFVKLRGEVDLIFAGFPCQGFSHAGKKRSDDPRNELVHEFVRATNLIKPTWIIGENVKGLLSRKGVYPKNTPPRPVIDIIRELFEAIGYKLTYRVIDATMVGVPQLRKRTLIVGHRGDLYPHLNWPSVNPKLPTIRDLLTSTLEGAMELPATPYKPAEKPARFWIKTLEKAPSGTPHPNLVRLVQGIRNLSSKERGEAGYGPKERIAHTEPEGLVSFGVRKGGYHGQVLDPDAPSKTIICTYNLCPRLFVGLVNEKSKKYWVRCLTPEECGLIQGFPAGYPWKGSPKEIVAQIGNAVPPPLATTLATLLASARFEKTPQASVCDAGHDSDTDEDDE